MSLFTQVLVFAETLEFEHWCDTGKRLLATGHTGNTLSRCALNPATPDRASLSHLRFVIEGVDMTGATRHKEIDDPFCFRSEIGKLGQPGIGLAGIAARGTASKEIGIEKCAQRDGSEPVTGFEKQIAPGLSV